jgi:hypothetical protein
MTPTRGLRILAWLLLVGLAFVTVAPIEFRPVTPLPTQLERALALALVGFVFALAYPRRILLVVLLLFASTTLFEALQLVEPSRHGRFLDLAVKLAGCGLGLACGSALALWSGRKTKI